MVRLVARFRIYEYEFEDLVDIIYLLKYHYGDNLESIHISMVNKKITIYERAKVNS